MEKAADSLEAATGTILSSLDQLNQDTREAGWQAVSGKIEM